MDAFWEFLRKLACRLRAAAAGMNGIAAAIETLLAMFGPGFGFAAG